LPKGYLRGQLVAAADGDNPESLNLRVGGCVLAVTGAGLDCELGQARGQKATDGRRWQKMVFAPLTRHKHSPRRDAMSGARAARPAYPLSSSSIRGLSLFLFDRVTLSELVGRQTVRSNFCTARLLPHRDQRRAMKRRSTYQNIMAMPAKSWMEAATSAFGGNPRMTFDVV